jgi:3-deoxy-manno-octulosonate cytidylyltransferase (CMP-KDO synthetase)
VATDDERVAKAAREAEAETLLTPVGLPSGSDRVAHVVRELVKEGDIYDIIVNIQGDEPFLPGGAIDRAVEILAEDLEAGLSTLAIPVPADVAADPNVVKVVVDRKGRALYFSRSAIPHGGGEGHPFHQHVGLYAFRRSVLDRFVNLGVSPLERTERLEQLRALEDGMVIAVALGDWPVQAVDTPEDLVRAERRMTGKSTQ